MKEKLKSFTAAAAIAVACLFSAHTATAQLVYDQNIVAIFGSGNPNTGWTQNSNGNLSVAMRAKSRVLPAPASTANVNGIYAEDTGYTGVRAKWNWEFSINSGNVNLNAYDYYLGIDTDISVGVSHTIIDPMTIPDNSYGNAGTANGAGIEGTAETYAGVYSIAQQSHNITFYTALGGQDPNANATYDYELFAVAKGAGPTGDKIVAVEITVVVGTGGATVEQLLDQLAATAENHGAFMKEVNDLLKYLQDGGVINKKQRQTHHKTAAQTTIPVQP